MYIRIPCKIDALDGLVERFDGFCEEFFVERQLSLKLQLVLEELVVNIIHHGIAQQEEPAIDIYCSLNSEIFTLEIVDTGHAFNPLAHKTDDPDLPFEEREIGGMGLRLVREIMDSITYQYKNGKNSLQLTRKFARESNEKFQGREE